jgi:hypothetical protein
MLSVLSAGWIFPLIGFDEPLKVLCEIDQENLETGRAFSITLVVNHEEIQEVTVIPPDFEDNFRLERQRSSMRLVRGTAQAALAEQAARNAARNAEQAAQDAEHWSVFEFTLVPLEEGLQTLAPFTVLARGQSVWTAHLPLAIAPARIVTVPPAFRWETPFPALKAGEWSVFRLITTDPAALRQNALQRIRFEPPPEAIVESVTLTPAAGRNTAVIELHVLPLRPGTFAINAIPFEAESRDGTVMSLRIPELRATIR